MIKNLYRQKKTLGLIIIVHLICLAIAVWSYNNVFEELPWYAFPLTLISPLMILLFTGTLVAVFLDRRLPAFFLTLVFIFTLSFGIIGLVFFSSWIVVKGFTWWRLQNIFSHAIFGAQAFVLLINLKKIPWYCHLWLFLIYSGYLLILFLGGFITYFSTYPYAQYMEVFSFSTFILVHGFLIQRLKNMDSPDKL